MFVFNMKLTGKKMVCFTAAAIVVAVICIICMISIHSKTPDTATCDEAGAYSLSAEDKEEQCEFLEQFGLTADPDSSVIESVIIPYEFNSVYESYNDIQKEIGLDLSKYKGKTAEKITYTLENSKARYAVLLIYRGNVIGAHLTNGEYGQENLPLI